VAVEGKRSKVKGVWKWEYKGNLWFDCIEKEHLPVVVGVANGNQSITMYCRECSKVWRIGSGYLQSILVSELSKVEDCKWKLKVLELAEA
jgi:hypothetical protein